MRCAIVGDNSLLLGSVSLSFLPNGSARFRFGDASMKQALLGVLGLMFFAVSADAEDWYLMAPYENVMENPMGAHQLAPGATNPNSPLTFISHGTYSNALECDVARRQLMQQWRRDGSISEQQFRQWGGASIFFFCVPSSNPHLTKSKDGAPMIIY
jgi:hypothetical protein